MAKKGKKGKKGRKKNKKVIALLENWIKNVASSAALETHEEEERQLQVDARILNRYVKKHIKGPRAVEGLKPTTYIVRQTYEEQLAFAMRQGEIEIYHEAQQQRDDLLVMWRACIKLQRIYRRRHAERDKAARTMQRMFRGFKKRKEYYNSDAQVNKRKEAEIERKLNAQAALKVAYEEKKAKAKAARIQTRREVDLCLGGICAQLCNEEDDVLKEEDEAKAAAEEEERRVRHLFGAVTKKSISTSEEALPPIQAARPPRIHSGRVASRASSDTNQGVFVVSESERGDTPIPLDSPMEAEEYVGAWPELITDVNEDMDISAIRIQSAIRSKNAYRKAMVMKMQRQAENADNPEYFRDLEEYTDREQAQITICQAAIRRFLAVSNLRVSRLERASVVMDPGAQQVHVNEKKHVPFARRLTRIVADSKLNLEELTRSSELAFDNADVQLLSPQKPAKANLFPPITMSSVEFKAPRPYSAPLVGVGQQTVDSRTTLSAGHEVGMGIGIKSAIPEEEETEAEPVDSAMETYQTVHDAAQTRLSRCREMIGSISTDPNGMQEELTKELDVILWTRFGAPPVYHLGEGGKLQADPFAPSRTLYPNASGLGIVRMPDTPSTWNEQVMLENKTRRLAIMDERRRQTTAFLEAMEQQRQMALMSDDRSDGASVAASARSMRKGKLNKKSLRRLDSSKSMGSQGSSLSGSHAGSSKSLIRRSKSKSAG
mmetsp:Transcript_26180/g.49731  ORF Transcript_26180/g.49731 Transcript_26180/m.49731 type:complete len:718 (-) Transcript_26180:129-2282(-)